MQDQSPQENRTNSLIVLFIILLTPPLVNVVQGCHRQEVEERREQRREETEERRHRERINAMSVERPPPQK